MTRILGHALRRTGAGLFLALDIVAPGIYNTSMRILKELVYFDWDKGNEEKSLLKHGVTNKEGEEAFFDKNSKIFFDVKHSGKEKRYINYGRTNQGRYLITVFIKRKSKIRIISSRDMKKKERITYEKATHSS